MDSGIDVTQTEMAAHIAVDVPGRSESRPRQRRCSKASKAFFKGHR